MKKNYAIDIAKNIKSNYIRMIILAFSSFISSVVFARYLGPTKYGAYTYLMWITATFAAVLGLGFAGTITKFLPHYYFENRLEESSLFLKKLLIIQAFVVIIVGSFMILTYHYWNGLVSAIKVDNTKFLFSIAIINILPATILAILISSIQSLQRFDIYTKISVKVQFTSILLSIISVLIFGKIEYLLIILFISHLYQCIKYSKFLNESLGKVKIRNFYKIKLDYKRIFKYSSLMYINVMWQQVVFTKSEFFFLGLYADAFQIAIYGIAYSLVNILSMLTSPIINVLNNYFSNLVAKKQFDLLEHIVVKTTRYFAVSLFFILTFVYAFSKEIIEIVYTNQYIEVVICFIIMSSGFVLLQILSVAGSLPFLLEKQGFIIKVGILCGVLNLLLDIYLIPNYGAVGASIANTSVQVLSAIIGFCYIKKITGFEFQLYLILSCFILTLIAIFAITITNILILKILVIIIYTLLYVFVVYKLKLIDINQFRIELKLSKSK